MEAIFSAWGRILTGYKPFLSIEITREGPLRCPGCYAYGDEHLGGAPVGAIFTASVAVGEMVRRRREHVDATPTVSTANG